MCILDHKQKQVLQKCNTVSRDRIKQHYVLSAAFTN